MNLEHFIGSRRKSILTGQHSAAAQIFSALRYILGRLIAVSLTIAIGVFVMVVIANAGGMLDATIRAEVEHEVRRLPWLSGIDIQAFRQEREAAEGLSLSFWPKHLRYTLRAFTMDWGDVLDRRKFVSWIESGGDIVDTADSRTIILSRLPETLLLSGTAFLLVALLGLPLALYLSQREGKWLDRAIGVLSPLSSMPSWVIGVLLVLIFAVQIKLLPPSRMYDAIPPTTLWGTITTVTRHMVLPVLAIMLSIFFQLVYGWRTYLLIYSSEDYVDLAKAKGLRPGVVNARYILRPALPYMITSLALTLVGFWQMTAALEFLFQWPGIGKLFVDALPNFHQEAMYPGEMSLVLGIIMLFAYLLGFTIILLDFLYVLVDPRIRIGGQDRKAGAVEQENWDWRGTFSLVRLLRGQELRQPLPAKAVGRRRRSSLSEWARVTASNAQEGARQFSTAFQHAIRDIARVPSAVAGLALAALLILAAVLITIFIPFDPVAKQWSGSGYTENPVKAKQALPIWVNWLRAEKLPATMVLNGSAEIIEQAGTTGAGTSQVSLNFAFDYPYRQFPSELALYTYTTCEEKDPFVSMTWLTPDGREIGLKNSSVRNNLAYPFNKNIRVNQELSKHAALKQWFKKTGGNQTPPYLLLFADPDAEQGVALPGQYRLRMDGILFEEGCELNAKLVVFGLVEGWAGTDYLRRDLLIPLLWGLPFALLIGVGGAVITSILSLTIAAASAWMGGWVDFLVQRATEANMILPVMGVGVLLFAFYQTPMLVVIGIILLSYVLGNSTKVFRAAFLQEKKASYVEAARTYGASDWRIITQYLIRRLMPIIFPQAVLLIPSFIFLEATLAIFNITDPRFPTWGYLVFSGLRYGALFGSKFWVLGPIGLMLLTSLTFVLISFALNRLLNPQLKVE